MHNDTTALPIERVRHARLLHRRPARAVSTILAIVALTACSDDDGRDSNPNAAKQTPVAGAAAPPAPDSTAARTMCSGCAQETPDAADATIHLHHVHMNVADVNVSTAFYEKVLGADRVRLNGVTDALYSAPTLLLLEPHDAPIGTLPTALQHIGWGSSDVSAWFDMATAQGVGADTRGQTLFGTPATPLVGEPGQNPVMGGPACFPRQDAISYIYVLGPDDERIEIWSGADQRINHVHFTTADVMKTGAWYQTFLKLDQAPTNPLAYSFFLDDILFFFEAIGTSADYTPTDDHTLGHIAFSVTDLDAWRERAIAQGVEIVAEPAHVHGFESFFVRGPDGMLIELVQAAPLPDLCPDPSGSTSR